jgi:hypothetical protein
MSTAINNLFRGQPLFTAPAHPRHIGLRGFLTRDTGPAVFRHEYHVCDRRIYLHLSSRGERTYYIGGLGGLQTIHVGIQEEQIGQQMFKVLYGWKDAADWGNGKRNLIRYILAEKIQSLWRLKHKPEALSGLSPHQRSLQENKILGKALTRGLGRTIIRKIWPVCPANFRISFIYRGQQLYVNGFPGQRTVYSLIEKEQSQIIGRFYANKSDADHKRCLLKTVVFAEKAAGGRWSVLQQPKILFTTPAAGAQHAYLRANQAKQFILDDQESETSFDVGRRKIYRGAVRLAMDDNYISLPGFTGFDSVTGMIVNHGQEKKIYFWPDEKAKRSGVKPLIPGGQVVGRKIKGKWEIVWLDPGWGHRREISETTRLGNFIFATVGNRIYTARWPVYDYPFGNGRLYPQAKRHVRGRSLFVILSGVEGLNGQVITQVREFGGRLKMIEFWANSWSFIKHAAPCAARFIAIRPNGSGWDHFWHPVDSSAETTGAFQELIDQGSVTQNELSVIFSDPYFSHRGYQVAKR